MLMRRPTRSLGDRYELGRLLGQGGMARVYLGTDRILDRPVAVKVLAEPYDRDRGYVQRFQREARAAARLSHPNIVQVFDSGSDDRTHFIVMELVEGRTLSDRLHEEGPMAPNEVIRIGGDVARALAAAHDRGVIHRDVKPGNVMLTKDGRVKVVDFGIAHASGAEAITRSGLVMGSASCLSPEQAQGASGDQRSDIYALGCVLYHMLTGRPPYVADEPMATLYQHVNEPLTPPSSIRPVPPELERVILRCLEKDPSRRFDSAGQLLGALSSSMDASAPTNATEPMPLLPAAFEPTQPVARPIGASGFPASTSPTRPIRPMHRAKRPSRRWTWGVVASVVAAVLVLAGVLALLPDPAEIDTRGGRLDAGGPAGAPSVAPSDEPQSVADAYEALRGHILAAERSGAIDDDLAEDLLGDADEVFAAWEAGDAGTVQDLVADLTDDLAAAAEDGEVTGDAAPSIGASLSDLISAIENDRPATTQPSPSPTDGHDEGQGEGELDGGGGSGPG